MMNTATFLASCVLFATAISLIALFADGWLRRYATARHAMHLSALVLILLSPALIALQRANHIGSRNHLAWLLPNETANSVDSEFLEPPTSSKPSLATGSDVIERSAEPMTTDGMQGQSQGTEQSADLQTASVNPISIQPTSSSTTPAKPGFLESFSWNQIIQVGRYMSPWAIAIACLGTVAMLARMGVGWVRLHQIIPPELEADLKQQGEYDQTAEMIQTLGDAKWLQGQPIDIVTAEADFRLVVFGLSPSHFEQARLVRQLYVDSGVLIVGVHSKAFLLKEGSDLSDADLRFPVVIDDDVAKIRSRYGVDSNPVALLYDRDGRLIEKIERSTNLLWIMRNHLLYDAR